VDKQVLECVEEFHKYKQSNQLLLLPFVTIQDYLFLLRDISRELGNRFGSRAMWLLAAAVSDFHIPSERMVHSSLI
jgi:phosphopantothenate---cysteine ligase (ATP)